MTRLSRRAALAWLAALLLVTAALAPAVALRSHSSPSPSAAPPSAAAASTDGPAPARLVGAAATPADGDGNATDRRTDLSGPPPSRSGDGLEALLGGVALADSGRVEVVFELADASEARVADLESRGATVTARHGRLVQARIDPDAVGSYRDLPWVERVRLPYRPAPSVVSEGVAAINATDVHNESVNGSGVKVGVIDTGFDPSNAEIASNVVANKSFTGDIGGSNPTHGTAVAEVIVDTAPGVDLYLANVGTDVQYANAVDWLMGQGVDLISMSLGFPAQPFDGTGFVSEVADNATTTGHPFVVSAGNSANAHWEGGYADADGDNRTEFASGDETNYLNKGNSFSGSVAIYLTWDGWPDTDQDYDLYLYRDGSDTPVEKSETVQDGDDRPVEVISASLSSDSYYVTVVNRSANGTSELELYSFPTHLALEHRVTSSSLLAPATGNNVTAVGAFNHATPRTVESFSSRGPTDDGRVGVDVVGPDNVSTSTELDPFFGTSAAAPHVAGVAALALAREPGLAPGAVEPRLRASSIDIEARGEDHASGRGRLDALAAAFAGDVSASNATLSRSSAVVGETVRGNVTLSNAANATVNAVVTPSVDGAVYTSRVVPIAANGSERVGFAVAFEEAGTRTVTVNGATAGSVTVERTEVGLNVTANATTVEAGGAVTLAVTRNDTGAAVENATVTVSPGGGSRTTGANGTVEWSLGSAGEFRFVASKENTSAETFANDSVNVTVLEPGAELFLGDGTAPAGENATVAFSATASNVSGYRANVTFDPAVVSVLNVTGADFPAPSVAAGAGWVAFNASGPATDDPTLATLVFHVDENATGATNLSFVRAGTNLTRAGGGEIRIDAYHDGSVAVGQACEQGDASGDGSVTSGDATLVLRAVVGLTSPSSLTDCADFNGDGSITSGDATLVLRKVVGLST